MFARSVTAELGRLRGNRRVIDQYRRCVSALVTATMVVQNLTLGGAVAPAVAWAEPTVVAAEQRDDSGFADEDGGAASTSRDESRDRAPVIESVLHADGGTELLARIDATLTDSFMVTGLPAGVDAKMAGALATTDGEALAEGVMTVKADEAGSAQGELIYPSFDATRLVGKRIVSTLSVEVDGHTVVQFPSAGSRESREVAEPQQVVVITADNESGDEDGGPDDKDSESDEGAVCDGEEEGSGEAADGEKSNDADETTGADKTSDAEKAGDIAKAPETEGAVADIEKAAGIASSTGNASVSRADTGIASVVVEGEASLNRAKAMEALCEEVPRVEALLLASGIRMTAQANDSVRTSSSSNSAALDTMATGAPARASLDGNNIEDIQVKWVSKDAFKDDNDDVLSLRPDGLNNRTDAKQSVTAQIDYSVSGEHDYAAGDIRIMVPATMFTLRDGKKAGDVVIPLAEAPGTSTDFNWALVDDYYVFVNTRAMSAATKGFIQIQWNNLTPHEIADAYASVYDGGRAESYNDGESHVVDQNHTKPWYAYMEVTTYRDNTLRAVSNEITGLMDTTEVVDAGYKRVQSGYPRRTPAKELPAEVSAKYPDESEFVVVDWYTYAHYKGNQPFKLDVRDRLDIERDRESGVTMPGIIYEVTPVKGEASFDEDGATYMGSGIHSGWTGQEKGNTSYVHLRSAYPFSQFEAGKTYHFHNQVDYTLTPIDDVDAPTKATATASTSFSWHPSEWKDTTGHFMVFKWGNDGENERENYTERDMLAHRPDRAAQVISRMGTDQHYSTWYGIYDDAINRLRDHKDADENVKLWYTIKSEGWVLPWTLQQPTNDKNAVNGWWQWAKWEGDDETGQYVIAPEVDPNWMSHAFYDEETNTYVVDRSKTDGYALVPYTRIEGNYLKRPVTMVTTDQGLRLEGKTSTDDTTYDQSVSGGTELVAGDDYVFDTVEVQKPRIGKVKGINVNADGGYSVSNSQDGTFDYAEDEDGSKIPAIVLQVEVGGTWLQTSPTGEDFWAKVDWSSGRPVTTYADGHTETSAVVQMPTNTTNFRSVATTTQNAYLMEYLYPSVILNPDGQAKLRQFCADKFTDDEGNMVYVPESWVYNGVHMDAYQYDNDGKKMNETNPIFRRTKWGEDRIYGFSADVQVDPSKSARFDHKQDVDYESRVATVHYTAKVEEKSFLTSRELYDKAVAESVITPETGGVWYDLLPKGMVVDFASVKLREGDAIRRMYARENWRGTGRTMLVIEADLTPQPKAYKQSENDAVSFWEDVPTLSLDATMDLDTWIDLGGNPADVTTGVISHNVVAFESNNDVLGTVRDHSGEYDAITQDHYHNIATKVGSFSKEERAAFAELDPGRATPSFVYAECETNLAFPTAGRTSLSKNVMVNDDGRWSQGTYDDVRTVYEGGFYSYRLRMMSDSSTKSKDLVLYDSLENYRAVDGNDDADIDAPRWRGQLVSVDVSQIESMGCVPVVYYSTEEDLSLTDPDNARRSNADNIDITNAEIWVRADRYDGEPADVHAIAIDCSKAADGKDFVLGPDESMTAYVRMHAPWGTSQWDEYEGVSKYYHDCEAKGSARDYIAKDAHAYNNVYLVSTSVDADAEFPPNASSTLDFIRFDYTKVGLAEYRIAVNKVLDDDNDRDGKRPDKVVATLYANGLPASKDAALDNKLVLTAEEGWTGEFRNLPYTDSNGERIYYRVVEEADAVPKGYTARATGNAEEGFTLTNRHESERTSASGTKHWINDSEDMRPSAIDVQLYANGEFVSTKRVVPTVEVVRGAEGDKPAVTRQVWPTYTFDNLYKYEDGKEIEYTVREVVPDDAYISIASGMDITNTYHPFGGVSITKKVTGATDAVADKSFEFEVTLERPLGGGELEPLTDSFVYDVTTTDDADRVVRDGKVSSGEVISLKANEVATIRELPHRTRVSFVEIECPGFVASGGNVKVTTVQQNRIRKLTMDNVYHASGSVGLSVRKELAGAALRNNKFSFEVIDERGNVVRTASNRADGSVTFGALTYGSADAGKTYSYTIRERVPDEATNSDGVAWADATDEQRAAGGFSYKGYTYDSAALYTATVDVRDERGEGELDVSLTYTDKDGKPADEPALRSFKNSYTATGTTNMTAWKVLDDGGLGRELQAEEFKFELVPVGGKDTDGNAIEADDVPMPTNAGGERISPHEKANDAQGVIRFDEIRYTQDDAGNTYHYVVRELPGDDDTVTYSEATFRYVVKIHDNGDGTLSVEQENENSILPVFVNGLVGGGLSVEKLVEGENPDPSQEFTFHVRLTGEKVAPDAVYEYELDRVEDADKNEDRDNEAVSMAGAFGGMLADFASFLLPTVAYAIPAEGAQVVNSWHVGNTCEDEAMAALPGIAYDLHDDGTLVIRPESGDEGAGVLDFSMVDEESRAQAKSVEVQGTIHLEGKLTGTFSGFDGLESVDLRGLDTSRVDSLARIFKGCAQLQSANLAGLDTRNVTSMRSLFEGCAALTDLELTGWDTGKVSDMSEMFNGCQSLTELDLAGWDTGKVMNMQRTFKDCSSLEVLNVSSFDTSRVTNLYETFCGCESVKELDLGCWDMSKVGSNESRMFASCTALERITFGEGCKFKNATIPRSPSPLFTGAWTRITGEPRTEYPSALVKLTGPDLAGTWVWTKAELTLHFDANGGEGTMDDYRITETTFTLPANGFTNDLAEFAGWEASAGNVTTCFDDQDVLDIYNAFQNILNPNISKTGEHFTTLPPSPYMMSPLGNGNYEKTLKAMWTYTEYELSYVLAQDDAERGASGSMSREAIAADEAHDIAASKYYWFGHRLSGWDVSVKDKDGNDVTRAKAHYEMGEAIAAGDFCAGDRVTFTATWAEVDCSVQAANGEFTFTLHGGERATFDDIPAGTAYEVWEDTPDGWVLVKSMGTDGTILSLKTAEAKLTNKHTDQQVARQTLHATKLLQGSDGQRHELATGRFRFELRDKDGQLLQIVSNGVSTDDPTLGTIDFHELTFTEAGTYEYTIAEVKGNDGGVTYAENEVRATIEVIEEADGAGGTRLVAQDPVYDPEAPVFVNELLEEANYGLTIRKLVEGTADVVPTFDFEVTLNDERGRPLPKGTEYSLNGEVHVLEKLGKLNLAIDGEGVAELAGLPEGTSFAVSETSIPAGWTLTASDGTTGVLGVDNQSPTATFTNEYSTSGLFSLVAHKELIGGNFEEGDFTFALYADAECTEQLQTKSNGPVGSDGKATVCFDPIQLTEAGTYTYYVRELAGDDPTIDYDTKTVLVATVTAIDNGSGMLTCEVSYESGLDTIANTKRSGELVISKILEDASPNVEGTEFFMSLSLADANGQGLDGEYAWTSDREGVVGGTVHDGDTLPIHGNETITVTGLPDGAHYAVAEDEESARALGFVQSATEDIEGAVLAGQTSAATITNTYEVAAAAQVEATKTLRGRTLEEEAFEFQLLDEQGVVIDTAVNDADGRIAFDELSYGLVDEGKTYAYAIREVKGGTPGVTYDSSVFAVIVSLARDDGGDLVAKVAYAKDGKDVGSATFENVYEATGEGRVEVAKELVGEDLTAGQFGFTLRRPNDAALSTLDERTSLAAQNDEEGKVVFPAIPYARDDIGKTYTYIVSEDEGNEADMSYDAHLCTVRMEIADGGDGTIVATPTYTNDKNLFVNTKNVPTEGNISAKKLLSGRDWLDEDAFTFTLEADRYNPDEAAMPETSELTITKADADTNFTRSFGSITFRKAGGYRYIIREMKGSIDDVIYDEDPHVVDINVVDDGSGHLVAKQGSELVQVIEIENVYEPVDTTPESPSFEKKVKVADEAIDEASAWQDSAEYEIGDAVPYKLSATLPSDVTSYNSYRISFIDDMEEGLTFDGVSQIDVIASDGTQLASYEGDVLEDIVSDSGEHGFKATLRWGGDGETLGQIGEELSGATVNLYLTATLNEQAKLGQEGNLNKAKLSYSSHPDTAEEGETEWDEVTVYVPSNPTDTPANTQGRTDSGDNSERSSERTHTGGVTTSAPSNQSNQSAKGQSTRVSSTSSTITRTGTPKTGDTTNVAAVVVLGILGVIAETVGRRRWK